MHQGEGMDDPWTILPAWPNVRPEVVRQITAGANNVSSHIETPSGGYVLRISRDTSGRGRVKWEHALLQRLRHADLSFAVPRPIPTASGRTYEGAAHDEWDSVARLVLLIPGREPEHGNVGEAAICGEALGELDGVLSRIDTENAQPRHRRVAGHAGHGASVLRAIAEVSHRPTDAATGRRLDVVSAHLSGCVSDLLRTLPSQLIHADFDPSNTLVSEGKVSGVLDFELSAPGPRALDLATGLRGFGIASWCGSPNWSIISAFAAGYQQRIVLTPDELSAVPALLLWREATSLAHWLERLHLGLTTETDVARRVTNLLHCDDWLLANGDELIRRIDGAAP